MLNVNKPPGWTSRDVVTHIVRSIRRSTGEKIKAGHAGTLDPLAQGVLVVCLGKATRLIPYVQQMKKTYQGRFQIDMSSPSADLETSPVPVRPPIHPTRADIESVLSKFTGAIQQTPPEYSAVMVQGTRAYKLARQGAEFEIKPRRVTVYRLKVNSYEYPFLDLEIECGSGTYIRSLGRDLARALGSDAVMTDLCRTAIGSFRIEQALDPDSLAEETILQQVESPLKALEGIATVRVSDAQRQQLAFGRTIEPQSVPEGCEELVAIDSAGKPVAVLRPLGNAWKPGINFL